LKNTNSFGGAFFLNKNVIISVKGTQSYADTDENRLELVTEGKYYRKDNTYYITYKESEMTGMEGTTTTLKVKDGTVTLMRFGSVNSQFIFQKGQKHISYYDTTYGAFTISVFTNSMDISINDSGGEIKVDYELEVDNNKSGENDFYMLIREAGQSNDEHCGQNERAN
jgi:uncharacterized beta-barrel protein YwiB (DUF1934 family)